jgi:hypothetical protein
MKLAIEVFAILSSIVSSIVCYSCCVASGLCDQNEERINMGGKR